MAKQSQFHLDLIQASQDVIMASEKLREATTKEETIKWERRFDAMIAAFEIISRNYEKNRHKLRFTYVNDKGKLVYTPTKR